MCLCVSERKKKEKSFRCLLTVITGQALNSCFVNGEKKKRGYRVKGEIREMRGMKNESKMVKRKG